MTRGSPAAALASHTERLRFLLALRPGVASPTYVARQAAALDRISNGRFLVNIVSGGNPAELAGMAFTSAMTSATPMRASSSRSIPASLKARR